MVRSVSSKRRCASRRSRSSCSARAPSARRTRWPRRRRRRRLRPIAAEGAFAWLLGALIPALIQRRCKAASPRGARRSARRRQKGWRAEVQRRAACGREGHRERGIMRDTSCSCTRVAPCTVVSIPWYTSTFITFTKTYIHFLISRPTTLLNTASAPEARP
jgi:hypothetical protein